MQKKYIYIFCITTLLLCFLFTNMVSRGENDSSFHKLTEGKRPAPKLYRPKIFGYSLTTYWKKNIKKNKWFSNQNFNFCNFETNDREALLVFSFLATCIRKSEFRIMYWKLRILVLCSLVKNKYKINLFLPAVAKRVCRPEQHLSLAYTYFTVTHSKSYVYIYIYS